MPVTVTLGKSVNSKDSYISAVLLSLVLAASPNAAQGPAAVPTAPATAGSDIVVTATGRRQDPASVPVATTRVSGDQLAASGVGDLRGLNELVPSLLISSSSNEAGGAGARIRGVGTVGDNAGLESSVATYVDGIYRPRVGVALTELGPIEQAEVLRGPQGTLFGRNASAGLIAITTAPPSFTPGGYAAATMGNYAATRLEGGATGGLSSNLAARFDGVWLRRNGFIEDGVSGRRINDRERWLTRGKLLFRPDDATTVTFSFDYSRRREECCAGVYLPARDLRSSTPGVPGGAVLPLPSSIAALIRARGGQVLDGDPSVRRVALTPGQSFRQDVEDYGTGLKIEKQLGGLTITAISGWRTNRFIKGQDADFAQLDLTQRPSDGSGFIRFRDFSHEVRVRGSALAGHLDWLAGAYAADERLTLQDNLRYGSDYDGFAAARTGLSGGPFAAFPTYGFGHLQDFVRQAVGDTAAAVVQNVPLAGTGELDRWRQHDSNQALFGHVILNASDRLALTVGARWTRDRKALDANLASTSLCDVFAGNVQRLRALGGPAAALANGVLAPLAGYPCNINSLTGRLHDRRTERRWTGTAAASYRMAEGLTTYASWSRGYKAGGFNLDRAALYNPATLTAFPTASLRFGAETVDSWEVGAKLHRHAIDLAVTLFSEQFSGFQLNAYTGTNFLVSNIAGCRKSLGSTDSDNVAGNSACDDTKAGVRSRGVEVEGTLRLASQLTIAAGLTYADTRYASDLAGTPDPVSGNNSLQPVLFLLPGNRLSNAPAWVATGSAVWRPVVGRNLRALVYLDTRWQSRINTGSDLLAEKAEGSFATVNARVGISTRDDRWSVELWAQNLTDATYVQVAFAEPLQGGGSGGLPGTYPAVARFGTSATQLFGGFLGEPRTWGATVRRHF